MDFLLPDNETMKKMSAEYAKLKRLSEKDTPAGIFNSEPPPPILSKSSTYGSASRSDKNMQESLSRCDKNMQESVSRNEHNAHDMHVCNECTYGSNGCIFLLLYFALFLGYNSRHGTSFYDTNRGVGGIQSGQGTAGDLNNFFRRD